MYTNGTNKINFEINYISSTTSHIYVLLISYSPFLVSSGNVRSVYNASASYLALKSPSDLSTTAALLMNLSF